MSSHIFIVLLKQHSGVHMNREIGFSYYLNLKCATLIFEAIKLSQTNRLLSAGTHNLMCLHSFIGYFRYFTRFYVHVFVTGHERVSEL